MRLIDADALKNKIEQHSYPLSDRINSIENGMFLCGIYQAVDESPTVDVVPVVRKPVKDYEGMYEVDNLARVFSINRTIEVSDNGRAYQKPIKGKQLAQSAHTKGYKTVSFTKHGKTKTVFVHRVVAEAFIENPANLPMVNHKDEDKTNNFPHNLEWCDARYNRIYGNAKENHAKKIRGRISEKRKPVIQRGLNGDFVAWYPAVSLAASDVGTSTGAISAVCRGKRKSANGFLWEYATDYCSYGEKMESEGGA